MENRSGLIYLIWLEGPRWTCGQEEGSHQLEAFNTEPTRGQCLPGHLSEGNTDLWGLTYGTEAFSEQDRSLKGVEKVSSPLMHLRGQRELNDNLQRSGIFVVVFLCRRDVVACIGLPDGDPSWERSFSRWPLGVCDYMVPVWRQFHPDEWTRRTRNLYNWSEPHNRCAWRRAESLLLSMSLGHTV